MMRKIICRTAAIVAAGLLTLTVDDAEARWGSFGSWGSHGGSWGSHGSWGSGGGSWGSHGSWGSLGGSWGSHGSWGIHGSWGGSWGSHGGFLRRRFVARYASHGSYGSYGASYGSAYVARPVVRYVNDCGGTIIHEESATTNGAQSSAEESSNDSPADNSQPDNTSEGEGAAAQLQRDAALFAITVPEDAVVFVNDYRTRTTGTHREYMSTGLHQGREYTYRVRAVVQRDSQELAQTKLVTVRGGETSELAFEFDKVSPATTTLTLNVPADAKVRLAGSDTSVQGTQRVFATRQLSAGQVWSNYQIVVSLERNGETLTQERTLEVSGGETYDLAFDFDDDIRLAAN